MLRFGMIRRVTVFFLLLGIACIWVSAQSVYAKPPEPVGFVNDFAGIIPDDVEASLEAKLRDHETKTTNEVVVVTVVSLGDQSIEEYTIELARAWGVGQKDKDNGLVLLVAPNERKVRIEVGYGLEGDVPDAIAKRIINKDIIRHFAAGDFPGGIIAGIDAILLRLDPPPVTPGVPPDGETDEGGGGDSSFGFIVFGIVVGSIALVGVGIALIVFIVKKFQAWRAEIHRRERVRKETQDLMVKVDSDLSNFSNDLAKLKGDMR